MLSTIVSYLKQFLVSIRARDQDEEEHSAEERQSMLEMANVFDFFQSLRGSTDALPACGIDGCCTVPVWRVCSRAESQTSGGPGISDPPRASAGADVLRLVDRLQS